MSINIADVDLTPGDIALNKFYTEFYYTKVYAEENKLTLYRIPFGYATEILGECNELIKKLELPLQAKINSKHGIVQDQIIITPI